MFLGDRRALVESLILTDTDEARERRLAELLPLQRADFRELFEAMAGLPVTSGCSTRRCTSSYPPSRRCRCGSPSLSPGANRLPAIGSCCRPCAG